MSCRFAVALALLLLLSLVVPTSGQTPSGAPQAIVSPESVVGPPQGRALTGEELDRRTEALASIMRCPVCQALSVADSPTTSALAMREEARDLLAAGYTEAQVLQYFETSYGEFILLAPKKKGFNWLVWLAPLLVLLVGGGLVVKRMKGERPSSPSEDDSEAVDDELAEYAEQVRREVSG
ncbi:MAG: cytochrome c-type biogenesis protein CcmH [Acidobacteriota bacterium]|nr:cytochrome c-type biogenesis protein CcmH [Acidobacteriota bacterium]